MHKRQTYNCFPYILSFPIMLDEHNLKLIICNSIKVAEHAGLNETFFIMASIEHTIAFYCIRNNTSFKCTIMDVNNHGSMPNLLDMENSYTALDKFASRDIFSGCFNKEKRVALNVYSLSRTNIELDSIFCFINSPIQTIINAEIDINGNHLGHIACRHGYLELVKNIPVNVINERNKNGITMIELIIVNGHINCLLIILKKVSVRNIKTINGGTLLHLATAFRQYEMIPLLLKHIELNAVDYNGISACDLAYMLQDTKLIELLENRHISFGRQSLTPYFDCYSYFNDCSQSEFFFPETKTLDEVIELGTRPLRY